MNYYYIFFAVSYRGFVVRFEYKILRVALIGSPLGPLAKSNARNKIYAL